MNRVVRAVLWAIPPILFLVVLPRVLLGFVPATYVNEALALVRLNIPALIMDLTIFGIVLAALSALQTWAHDWSIVKPVASSLHLVTSYVLLLFFLGIGNPWTFGTANVAVSLSSLGVSSGLGSLSISLVSTFVALLAGIALILKITQRGMKFTEAGRFHALDVAQAVQASPAIPPARFCRACGSELKNGEAFCTNCGAQAQNVAPAEAVS